jgi:hypothetical protein
MTTIEVTETEELVVVDVSGVAEAPEVIEVVANRGEPGPAGPGVPVGGTADQVLAKIDATDYATKWTTPIPTGVPVGGTADQVLAKINSTNYATKWMTPAEEVAVQPNDPGGTVELWYDTDAVPPVTPLRPLMARVNEPTGVNVDPQVTTKITMSVVEYDTGGLWDAAGQGFRIPTGQAGVYRITYTIVFNSAAGGSFRWGRVLRNGSSFMGHDVATMSPGTGEGTSVNWSDDILCTAGAIYTVHCYHRNSAALATVKATFSIRKVADTP